MLVIRTVIIHILHTTVHVIVDIYWRQMEETVQVSWKYNNLLVQISHICSFINSISNKHKFQQFYYELITIIIVISFTFSTKDINECSEHISGCNQLCNNTLGSYNCTCYTGYLLGSNGRTCYGEIKCLILSWYAWIDILWLPFSIFS